ncbi:hypothetical protein J8F10_33000 [Gemmata sp. G18]|uniref:PEP-CTERM sorting domain-containing protein n=1 Tax=Gemmata palustris TaxID=2822762 RepID=A0ABS5C285_9BACT|nr:hypothetical protein [Gemmata palustris]MBP3960071.1 hypothetical protein [Gemmata palustris]
MKSARMLATCAKVLFAAVAICASAAPARADLQISLNESASNTSAGIFVYDVSFNTSVSGGVSAQRLQAGNFVTLYDVVGFKSAGLSAEILAADPDLFSLATPATGKNPAGFTPEAGRDTALPNVVLTYAGSTLTADTTFVGALTITSTATGVNESGLYASQVTRNRGAAAGSPIGAFGEVAVPMALPEPSGIFAAIAGLPCLGLVFGFARRRREIAAAAV